MTADTSPGLQQALADAARNYHRALVAAVGIGVAGLLVTALAGNYVAGVLLCVGLALGAVNSSLVQRSLVAFVAKGDPDHPDKRGLMLGVLRRLTLVSAVAFVVAYVYRPTGWVVLLGLALFQLLVMGTVFGGLFREVRRA